MLHNAKIANTMINFIEWCHTVETSSEILLFMLEAFSNEAWRLYNFFRSSIHPVVPLSAHPPSASIYPIQQRYSTIDGHKLDWFLKPWFANDESKLSLNSSEFHAEHFKLKYYIGRWTVTIAIKRFPWVQMTQKRGGGGGKKNQNNDMAISCGFHWTIKTYLMWMSYALFIVHTSAVIKRKSKHLK